MFLPRGIGFTHEAVRDGERQRAPWLSETLRRRRYGTVGVRWYVDETSVRVDGRWPSLDRAIARDGHLMDVRLSATHDLATAEAFWFCRKLSSGGAEGTAASVWVGD
jgi:transposase-like protein